MAEMLQDMCVLYFILTCLIATTCKGLSPLFEPGTMTLSPQENDKRHFDLRMFNTKFPFYGSTYEDLYISKDGMIGFSSDVGYNNVVLGSDTISVSVDKPFIAPFRYSGLGIAETLAGGTEYNGHIYYKSLDTNSGNDELRNISEYVRNAVVGADNFEASWALIVTWHHVVAVSDAINCPSGETPCRNNTFQAAVLTDKKDSYAIFNYEKMDIPLPSSASVYQAGFNAGRGRGWTEAIQKPDLQRANLLRGSSITGRYVFKISGERIVRGGCLPRSSRSGHLEMYPRFAGMFGGEMLEVSGQCLDPNGNIKCKFGNGNEAVVTNGHAVNSMKARCAVPRLTERGLVKLSMSRDGGSGYSDSCYITIVLPSRMPKYIQLPYNGKESGWNESSPEALKINWSNIDKLSNNTNAPVNINLIGYREDDSRVGWKTLKTLASDIPMSDMTYQFRVNEHSCKGEDCSRFETGYIEVALVNENDANMYRAFTSTVIPLGWFMNSAMLDQYGEDWPHNLCLNWYETDKNDKTWIDQLLYCPCTLQQAIVDVGRWQPDVACNMFNPSPTNCAYHTGASHCIRAVQPTSSGAGNQCCYNSDGSLRFSADTFYGSTPDRSHDWGAYPYKTYDRVPSMSHWVRDIVTIHYCCLWTDYKDCDYYMDLRPTRDCTGYRVPRAATIYGQAHVSTLDNAKFRMCGEGDYKLLQGPDFDIQGRFQHSGLNGPNEDKSVILTHVAVKVKSETIEIRLRHPSIDRSNNLLDVLVNKKYHFFTEKEMYWQDFKESAVVNTDLRKPNTQSNFTIIMKNGVAIQAADWHNILYLSVFIPPTFQGKVKGILGNWNGNTEDDLLPNNAATPAKVNDVDDLFHNFQYSWRIKSQRESIIPHRLMVDNSTNLCSLNLNPTSNEHLCNISTECIFDLRITGDINSALNTKNASDWISEMRHYLHPVRTCGLLNVPRSTKSSFNYSLGSTVTVTGCRQGSLSGETKYECVSSSDTTQEWSPGVTASCQVASVEEANIGMIVGIIVAVAAFIIIVLIVIFVVRRRGKGQKRDIAKPEQPKTYSASYSEVKKDDENQEA